jgi:hypothetical protein
MKLPSMLDDRPSMMMLALYCVIAAIIILISGLQPQAAEEQNKEGGISPDQATPLQPAGSMPAKLSGGSLGYRPGRFTPVPDLTTSSGTSRLPNWLPKENAK